ncbi:MAG: D-glycero-beta-D-manno-heptose 1-phosphate adenylyltransferase [Candidatus Omnitrophica bacterium CG11_big_fil_rev_8_21_14_0_20_64_10]|nr:MAG: D-glycero-beta-D-manno-heptose 1-phosphate adenylyltransferase [Candidatus Omnitrophica bacterium CG11_big_fil_rev_8_21_14_0_20_64_10]
MRDGVLTLKKMAAEVKRLRRSGKTIAFTNGCFDLLHVGHLDLLERIKAKADRLIIGINSDASVRRLKGRGRPVLPVRERARMLAALKPVDYVVVFSETTPERVIRTLEPDLLVKGGDWPVDRIAGGPFVRARGGRVFSLRLVPGRSTTGLLRKIRNSKFLR